MCPIRIEKCSEADLDLLTELFGQLSEDEKSDRVWDEIRRREALDKYMRGGSYAYFFLDGEETVGYALVNENASPLYLQHFFICREHRRQHYGKEAFEALMLELGADTIDLDAYVWNSRGIAFWRSLGFTDLCIMLRYHAPESK